MTNYIHIPSIKEEISLALDVSQYKAVVKRRFYLLENLQSLKIGNFENIFAKKVTVFKRMKASSQFTIFISVYPVIIYACYCTCLSMF